MKALRKEDLVKILDIGINQEWIFEDDLYIYFEKYGSDFYYDGGVGAIILSEEKKINFMEN